MDRSVVKCKLIHRISPPDKPRNLSAICLGDTHSDLNAFDLVEAREPRQARDGALFDNNLPTSSGAKLLPVNVVFRFVLAETHLRFPTKEVAQRQSSRHARARVGDFLKDYAAWTRKYVSKSDPCPISQNQAMCSCRTKT